MPEVDVAGCPLYYEVHGDGEPMVLLHGGQTDSSLMEDFASMLPDFRALLFDQRGVGRSGKPDVPYTIPLIANEVAALMRHLGFWPAHVLGVSMGGMVAQELVLRHPDAVSDLVLGCTLHTAPTQAIAQPSAQTGEPSPYTSEPITPAERAITLSEVLFAPGFVSEHPEAVDRMIAMSEAQPTDAVGLQRRLDAAYSWAGSRDRLGDIECPVLVMTGTQDQIAATSISHELASNLPSAELVVLDPAGHGFWIEQPAATREALMRFYARLKSAKGLMTSDATRPAAPSSFATPAAPTKGWGSQ